MPATLDTPTRTNAGRADLVTVSAVQYLSGLRYDLVRRLVDGGDFFHPGFQWVWNFSVCTEGERDLRFWAREVIAPETCGDLGLGAVLDIILPATRNHFHAGEVTRMFSLTHTALMRLRGQLGGRLQTSGSFYTRAGLEHFLRTRWIGVHIPSSASQFRPVMTRTTPAPEKDTETRQSALNGKLASIPARRFLKS
ncbi:MAG: hypothetical protein KGL39_13220 [Patescibacteria group bacterium]|nr:hypothetical protein [Patescibacteria group bacterium]